MTVTVEHYFAYGSNMNPDRVRERGIAFTAAAGARLLNLALVFDKRSVRAGEAHANIVYAPGDEVQGVLYRLATPHQIEKMDPFEKAPVNYGRDVVVVQDLAQGTSVTAWTYFANDAVREAGRHPPQAYLDHLLAGRPFLTAAYYEQLLQHPVAEEVQP